MGWSKWAISNNQFDWDSVLWIIQKKKKKKKLNSNSKCKVHPYGKLFRTIKSFFFKKKFYILYSWRIAILLPCSRWMRITKKGRMEKKLFHFECVCKSRGRKIAIYSCAYLQENSTAASAAQHTISTNIEIEKL